MPAQIQAADTAVELIRLFDSDRKRIRVLGRSALSALRVHEFMQKKPLINIGVAAGALNLSIPTVSAALRRLMRLGRVGIQEDHLNPGMAQERRQRHKANVRLGRPQATMRQQIAG
jgi:hypothetical protein